MIVDNFELERSDLTWQVLYHRSASLSFTDYQQTLAPQLNLEAFIEQARAYDMISKDSFRNLLN